MTHIKSAPISQAVIEQGMGVAWAETRQRRVVQGVIWSMGWRSEGFDVQTQSLCHVEPRPVTRAHGAMSQARCCQAGAIAE